MRPVLIALPQQLAALWDIVSRISFLDVVDILCVSVLLYYLFKFVRDRRAGNRKTSGRRAGDRRTRGRRT